MRLIKLFTFFSLIIGFLPCRSQSTFVPMYDSTYSQSQCCFNIYNTYQKTVATGDLNEDGYPDIASASYYHLSIDTYISLLYSNCLGTLGDSLDTLFVPVISANAVIEIFDINNDNHLDLVVSGNGELIYFGGDGLGNFSSPVQSTIPNQFVQVNYTEMTAGDFNNDGFGDIFITVSGSPWLTTRLMTGNAAGVFTDSGINFDLSVPQANEGPKVGADVNNDGFTDVVNSTGVAWLNGVSGLDSLSTAAFQYPNVITMINSLVVVQSDTDQVMEVYSLTSDAVYYGEVRPGSPAVLLKVIPAANTSSMAVGDFDYDGFVDDVVLLLQNDVIVSYRGNAGLLVPYNTPVYGRLKGHLCSADFNQDGIWDIYQTQDHCVNINFGSFHFSSGNSVPVNGTVRATCSADFDMDGYDDIAVSQHPVSNPLSIAYGSPCGFSRVLHYPGAAQFGRITSGYLNNDSLPDLVIGGLFFDSLFVYLNLGNRNFSLHRYYAGHSYTYPLTHDFNEDGYDDVFLLSRSPGVYNMLFADPSGTGILGTPTLTQSAVAIPGGVQTEDPEKADYNGDGHMDVSVSHDNAVGQRITIHYGDGTGNFPVKTAFIFGPFVTHCVPIHLNADSQIDMIASSGNWSTATTNLLCIDSATAQVNACNGSPYSFAMETITVADLNNDSINDFIGNSSNLFGQSAPYLLKPDYTPLYLNQLVEGFNSKSCVAKLNDDDFIDMVHFSGSSIIPYVNILPGNPNLVLLADTLFMTPQRSLQSPSSIEWYKDHVLIPGANQAYLPVTSAGYYQVAVYYTTGAMNTAAYNIPGITIGINQPAQKSISWQLFPNPANDETVLHTDALIAETEISVYSMNGKIVLKSQLQPGVTDTRISTNDWAPGVYMLSIKSDNQVITKKLVKL